MEASTTLNGCATVEGSFHYRERFRGVAAENYFRKAQNLWLSSIGIGTYLGKADEETDQRYTEAIVRSIELGANVISAGQLLKVLHRDRGW